MSLTPSTVLKDMNLQVFTSKRECAWLNEMIVSFIEMFYPQFIHVLLMLMPLFMLFYVYFEHFICSYGGGFIKAYFASFNFLLVGFLLFQHSHYADEIYI